MGKGGAFVFDPKLLDEVETKGKIKLFFRDTGTNYIQVHKNMSVTQKAKKVEFRTLETIISRYDEDLQIKSTITNKCINTEFEVINALGVSKAILDNVIFCHQEDSNWPLSDGKNLKTKFDEIFAATKYIKALDALRKVRLEKQHLVKQFELEKKHLEIHKQKAESLKSRVDSSQMKYDANESKCHFIGEKLSSIENKLETRYATLRSIQEIQLRLQAVENEKNLIEKQMNEYKQRIKNVFKGSDEELEDKLRNFDVVINNINEETRKKESEMSKIGVRLKEYGLKKTKLLTDIGAIENEQKNYSVKVDKFGKTFRSLAKNINFSTDSISEINVNALPQILNSYAEFSRDYENQTNKLLSEVKGDEQVIEEKVTSNRDKKSKLDQNIETLNDQVRKNEREIRSINSELDDAILLIENSEKLNVEINQVQVNLDKKSRECDINDLKLEINQLQSEKDKYLKSINDLNTELEEIQGMNEIQVKIDFYKMDKEAKQNSLKDIRTKHENDFLKFFGFSRNEFNELDDSKLHSQFSQRCTQLDKDIEANATTNKLITKEITTAESRLKMLKDEFTKKEQHYEDYKRQLKSIEDVDKFDLTLQETQEAQKAAIEEKSFLNGVEKTYQRFIKQLSATNEKCSCPVCFRGFKDAKEIEQSVEELKLYQTKLPKKIEDAEKRILSISNKYESLLKLKNTVEVFRRMRDQDLPSLKRQISELDGEELQAKRNKLEENEAKIAQLKESKMLANSLNNQITIVKKYLNEISETDNKLGLESSKLVGGKKAGKSVERIKLEKSQLTEKLETVKNQVEVKQKQMVKQQEEIQFLKDKLNNLTIKKLKFDVSSKNVDNLKEKLEKLKIDNKQNETQIDKNRIDSSSLALIINDLLEEKNVKTRERVEMQEQRRVGLSQLVTLKNELNELGKVIRNFEQNDMKRLIDSRENLSRVESDEAKDIEQNNKFRSEIEEIKNSFSQQEVVKRELDDNKRMRERKIEFDNKVTILKDLKEKINGLNLNELKKEIASHESEKKEFRKQQNDAESSLMMLSGTLKTLKAELETDEYVDADIKFSTCIKDLHVLEFSLRDIEKYSKALDKAIMNYHSMKMNEINKSIKQIWKQVYRG